MPAGEHLAEMASRAKQLTGREAFLATAGCQLFSSARHLSEVLARRGSRGLSATAEGMALLEERAAVKAAEFGSQLATCLRADQRAVGRLGPAEARLGAVDAKYFAKTLADAMTEVMRGEPRLDERVPFCVCRAGV